MKRTEAYEAWTAHLESWVTYLEHLITDCEKNNDLGTKIKYTRQLKALTDVMYGAVANPKLFTAFIHPEKITEHPLCEPSFYNKRLNGPQQEAVKRALSVEDLCLIQGPPGTGKTTVITEICLQILMKDPNSRILVCSETHIAVNNVIDKLYEKLDQFHAIRIRNKEMDPSDEIEQSTTDAYLDGYFQRLKQEGVRDEVREMLEGVLTDPEPSKRRDLEKQLIQSKRVVGITCNGIGAYPLGPDDAVFDYVIVDEVCKATLPEIILPMSIAKRAILVGDPKQLPPLFCKEDMEIMKETNSLDIERFKYIDQLFERIPTYCRSMLRKQFRMTNEIGDLVSECFYAEEGGLENGLDRPSPGCIQWVDYLTESRWPEEEGGQIVNLDEVERVKEVLEQENEALARGNEDLLSSKRAAPSTVAIISPYRPMVKTLRQALDRDRYDKLNIQIDTIDAFQGKDADIVIFCLTRNAGTLRFFSDPRRVNVALSRAKNKLWIVGNKVYAKRSPLLKRIMEACG